MEVDHARRILICGDRDWTDAPLITAAISGLAPGTVVIHGAAPGADSMAGCAAALQEGLTVLTFPARWSTEGRAAGILRNQRMLEEGRPTEVWAFHDDLAHSTGTRDMVRRATEAGLPVQVFQHASEP